MVHLCSVNLSKILLFLVISSRVSHSLHLELQSGRTKGISEDIISNSMTVGKYNVLNHSEAHPSPPSHKISIRVTSSYGNMYHHTEDVESDQFAFTTVETGDYMTCFTAADHKPEVMEFEVKKLIETVSSIHDEMFYLRER